MTRIFLKSIGCPIYISYYIDTEKYQSQLQCIGASVAGTSAIPVTEE